jgi:serine/threonine protein kinase
LTLLKDTGIVPRLLYADDTTNTLVEEDKGWLSMRNSPIPLDFDQQLRRILCLLRQNRIVHRDMTYPNFVIDEITGMIYLIDFGDSFTWYGGWYETQNCNWRNLQNLFTIWARGYDEEKYLEDFIDATIPEITGDRQWRPPAHTWTSLNQNKIGSLFIAKELLK